MDGEKVLEALDTYDRKLAAIEWVQPIDYPHKKLLPFKNFKNLALGHCLGMFPKMREFVAEGRMEKCFRWLGFVQGVLWALRIYTLEELKDHNRPSTDRTNPQG